MKIKYLEDLDVASLKKRRKFNIVVDVTALIIGSFYILGSMFFYSLTGLVYLPLIMFIFGMGFIMMSTRRNYYIDFLIYLRSREKNEDIIFYKPLLNDIILDEKKEIVKNEVKVSKNKIDNIYEKVVKE